MAEQRMRELGREGGVAWLAERLRRGDLERSMVELAAYCGDAEARLAAPTPLCRDCADEDGWCPNRDLPCDDRDFDLWLRGLERWPGALREAELACDVLRFGAERPGSPFVRGPADYALDTCNAYYRDHETAEIHGPIGEQRVREAIAARLRKWALR